MEIEEIKNYLEAKKKEAESERKKAQKESSEEARWHGCYLAFHKILEWIRKKEREERNVKFHTKWKRTI